MFSYLAHHAHIQTFKQRHTTGKTLLKVNLAPHSALGNGANLGTHAIALSQFVNALRLNKRGIHIEADQTPHPAEHIVLLEREIHLHLLRYLHQPRVHLARVHRLAAQ